MSPHKKSAEPEGLRALKKQKTRRAIEEAAAELFKKQGYEATTLEQIVKRAEISKPTFFRYFRNKADILLSKHSEVLPAVKEAIINRPADENDLVAIRSAFLQDDIEFDRSIRLSLSVMTSSLEEFSFDSVSLSVTRSWLNLISDALAQRHGMESPDEICLLSARIISSAVLNAAESWVANGCRESLNAVVTRNFDEMMMLYEEWRAPSKGRRKT